MLYLLRRELDVVDRYIDVVRTCLARGHRDPAQQTLDTTKNLAVINLLQKRSTEANKSLKS